MAIRVAKTKSGLVRGLPSGIPTVSVFKGIPYAAPPVGELRWKEPQPVSPWEGELEAYAFKAMALQDKSNVACINMVDFCDYGVDEVNSEDCLYLNVWTPARSVEEKLPVMIWIHGGGFVEDYGFNVVVDGDWYAARHGVILVSIEYRLGILGFLAHSELTAESPYHASGNYGLLDQQFAIQWVHDNIAAFGGDPENVTIFGESAGAFSVNAQLCSPLNRGLVQRAIIQSGGGFNNNVYLALALNRKIPLEEAEMNGAEVLKWLGVASVEEARQVPAERFIELQRLYPFRSQPIVDGHFLVESIDDTIAAHENLDIPVMIGFNEKEGNLFRRQGSTLFNTTAEEMEAQARSVFGDLADRYFEISGFRENPKALTDSVPERAFSTPILAFCEHEAERKGAANYLYCFTRQVPGDDIGPAHAMEMMYAFHTIHRNWRPFEQKDHELADAMAAYWCGFARSGDPNGAGLPEWQPYTATCRKAMELGEKIAMIDCPCSPTVAFEVDYILGRCND